MDSLDADLATLHSAAAHGVSEGFYEPEEVNGAYKRVKAEIARLTARRSRYAEGRYTACMEALSAAEAENERLQEQATQDRATILLREAERDRLKLAEGGESLSDSVPEKFTKALPRNQTSLKIAAIPDVTPLEEAEEELDTDES